MQLKPGALVEGTSVDVHWKVDSDYINNKVYCDFSIAILPIQSTFKINVKQISNLKFFKKWGLNDFSWWNW